MMGKVCLAPVKKCRKGKYSQYVTYKTAQAFSDLKKDLCEQSCMRIKHLTRKQLVTGINIIINQYGT